MATPGKDTAPFLQGNPATKASGDPKAPPFESRPQKMGSTSDGTTYPGGDNKHRGPDRPQPMRSPDPGAGDNQQSIPSGGTSDGKLPYPGPSKPTQTPFKLGQ